MLLKVDISHFRYMKEYAVMLKSHCKMVSMDDKCKVDLGEPGFPIAAVSRGKQVGLFTFRNLQGWHV